MKNKDRKISIYSALEAIQKGSFSGITELFNKENRLAIIEGGSYEEFKSGPWPSSPGVYLIYQSEYPDPVYIGMTGKLKRGENEKLEFNSGKLKDRFLRWTPYKFQRGGKFHDHWRCIPEKAKNSEYLYNFPLSTIKVFCLSMEGMECTLSPSALEALLLQHFIEKQNTLPLGNQEL